MSHKGYQTYSLFQEANQVLIIDTNNSILNAKLGNFLINWLIELKILTRKIISIDTLSISKKASILILEDQILKLLPKDSIPFLTIPVKIPMVSPP